MALVKDFMLSENSAVNLLWNYHEPISCFLFDYEMMVKRKRNYDIFMGIVTGNINANYHVLVAEMSTTLSC